ncbi:YbhB/YbcL family Raf kinase inhibitor-like protein [Geotalea uraniireducens]|nr:YbhB/YbcL family Raf kinase inhibitor-like protein [Geotalea uraniireducens]
MGKGITLLVAALGLLLAAPTAGKERRSMERVTVTSPVFTGGGAIPAAYTCDGNDHNPPLHFSGVPKAARSLALIVDDPDAPAGTWVHWVVWNISPEGMIGENSVPAGATEGRNSWQRNRYGGPCPPSGTHRYYFKLYALDTIFALGPTTTAAELERVMAGHVIGRGELMGTYRRR